MKEVSIQSNLNITCQWCHVTHKLEVQPIDVIAWQIGTKSVQGAFPYLSVDERELILSATCGTCWDEMYPENCQCCDSNPCLEALDNEKEGE